MSRKQLYNWWILVQKITVYNLKIIFANKFVWFLVASIIFFLGLSVIYALDNEGTARIGDMYDVMFFSGLLLVFYPSVFGIQNDQDARTIEILFGIPNYRYKVWLVRIFLIFTLAFLIILVYAWFASLMIVKLPPAGLTVQVMVPVLFLGIMAFMLSTLIRNGNGTAVVMIVIGIIFMILGEEAFRRSQWNIFLNPYNPPWGMNETAWAIVSMKNRIILVSGSVIFLLAALLNLQKREKFM